MVSDADWNDAPKGATHYDKDDAGNFCAWMMKIDEQAWCFFGQNGWVSIDCSDAAHELSECIPRPKWDLDEWLPCVGCECEMRTSSCREWIPVTIRYISKFGVVARIDEEVDVFVSCTSFPEYRPVQKKKAQDILAKLYGMERWDE